MNIERWKTMMHNAVDLLADDQYDKVLTVAAETMIECATRVLQAKTDFDYSDAVHFLQKAMEEIDSIHNPEEDDE